MYEQSKTRNVDVNYVIHTINDEQISKHVHTWKNT